jgi:glycerol-3-phosphate dehydrogenase
MTRDPNQFTARTFDLLVVGGGIYGLTIACDGAQRGLSVALIEGNDFGSGASFNHLRTIHGGLRYLQTLDFGRARESVRERRTVARIASSYVRPLPFVLPLTRSIVRGRLALRTGFLLDRLVAADRNTDIPASHELPAGQVLPAAEAERRFPPLSGRTMTGAAMWYDYVTTEAERLTLAWALSAVEHGAVVANYVRADALIREGAAVTGMHATDLLSGRTLEIRGRVVVNATGAAVDGLLAPLGIASVGPMMKAMNLVTTLAGGEAAIGSRSAGGRNYFMVPWRGRAVFGTWESDHACTDANTAFVEKDVEGFIADLNGAYPGLNLRREEVTRVHCGVVPARRSGSRIVLEGRERVADHASQAIGGLISVAGTKYTTARATAERIVDLTFEKLHRPLVPSRSARTPLPWSSATGDELIARAARHEMVATLADVVMRRTPLGSLGLPDDETLRHAAAIVGRELGWDEERQRTEIAAMRGHEYP